MNIPGTSTTVNGVDIATCESIMILMLQPWRCITVYVIENHRSVFELDATASVFLCALHVFYFDIKYV